MHVQCAIQNGYNVGFEIISSLDSEGVVNAGRFGNGLAQGEMVPQVCCPEHNLSHKQWIQLSARDVDGEVSWIYMFIALCLLSQILPFSHVSVSTPPCTSKWNQELHLLCDVTRPLFSHQELLIVRHINKIHYL